MFNLRAEFASADEVARQDLMWSVIRGAPVLDSRFDANWSTVKKKTAAIYGHRQIDPVYQVKIRKSLGAVVQLLTENTADNDDILNEHSIRHAVKNKIIALINGTSVDVNDVLQLAVRTPILAYSPEPPPTYDFKLPLRPTTGVSLFAFELMAFNNRVIYQYYEGVTFSAYFYHNAKYMLNLSDAERLETDERWQARLALLIKRTDFADIVSMAAFYEDTVRYRGVGYDTSFVPNYDVYSLTPASRIGCDMAESKQPHCTDSKCINHKKSSHDDTVNDSVAVEKLLTYRAGLDVRRVDKVPPEYMSVFLTFPFKDGHYIRPDGSILYLDVGLPRRASVTLTIERICDMSTLEQDVADAARTLRLQDVLAYALHADRLESQGVALLILRQMIGNIIKVNDIKIRLPYANEVLDWVARHCAKEDSVLIIMPKGSKDDKNQNSVATAVALIRDIAASAQSKLAAAFVCSSFHLMESDYRDAYDKLTTDAELYVFFTLVLQQYNVNAYRLHRDRLKPKFGGGRDTNDAFQYSDPMSFLANKYRTYTRPYTDSSVQNRLDAFTQPLVTPTDISATTKPICNPDQCMELYEFSDPQLNTLAATGTVDLTPSQIASYIALCIS